MLSFISPVVTTLNCIDVEKTMILINFFCVGFQQGISRERRRLGIKPNMPPPEEREQIKREQFNQGSARTN